MSYKSESIWEFCWTHTAEETAERAYMLLGLDAYEDGWKTNENKKHYKVNKKGTVVAGPKAMVGNNVNTVKKRTKEKQKSEQSKKTRRAANVNSYRDVTNEYIKKATPGKGNFEIEPGVVQEDRVDDIEMARWLHSKFGGDITVLAERHEIKGQDNPDYLWNGKLWDLKTPDQPTYNALNKRPRVGIEQIRPNPGGIIMNLNKCKASIEDAEIAIRNRMYKSAEFTADVIILHKGEQFKVLRFEEKSPAKQDLK